MNLSAATLQRRLLAEGTNYRQLKDELRRDIAIELFSNSTSRSQKSPHALDFRKRVLFTGPSGSGRGRVRNVLTWQGESSTVRTHSIVITPFTRSDVLARMVERFNPLLPITPARTLIRLSGACPHAS